VADHQKTPHWRSAGDESPYCAAFRPQSQASTTARRRAAAVGMAQSTVRRYLPNLIADERVRHTAYSGYSRQLPIGEGR
jgi:response regulator of citrate/malate metabolism